MTADLKAALARIAKAADAHGAGLDDLVAQVDAIVEPFDRRDPPDLTAAENEVADELTNASEYLSDAVRRIMRAVRALDRVAKA
jgi:ABC-type transporter Mla subunit MlaD